MSVDQAHLVLSMGRFYIYVMGTVMGTVRAVMLHMSS